MSYYILCSNPSYYTGHSTSLCNTHHTAICTALGREKLLVSSSPPSKNCQVSISSAIKHFHLFCCQAVSAPCSNQQGWEQLRFNPMWCWDLCSGVLKSWERLNGYVGLPFPARFLLGMQPRDSKGMVSKAIAAVYKLNLRRTCVSSSRVVVIHVPKFIFFYFSQKKWHNLQNFIKLAECTFLSTRFQYFVFYNF